MRVYLNNARWKGFLPFFGLTLVLAAMLLIVGCQGSNGANGTISNAVSGTVAGKITNSLTNGPVTGATITTDPLSQNITSDTNGQYSANLPVGVYTLTINKTNYTSTTLTVSVVAGQTLTKDFALQPTAKVVVSAGQAQTANPGTSVTLKATATPLDGSTVKSYQWTQTAGVPITPGSANSDALTVTLPQASAYKTALVKGLELLDRVEIKGINNHTLSGAEIATFKVTVTTSSGNYTGNVNVTTNLPYATTLGIADVPVGVPVLLSGKNSKSFSWTITSPAGSKADLDETTGRNPVFTPDVVGKYVIFEKSSNVTMNVYAGTWSGAISGQDAKGKPVAAACTTCHNGKIAPDNFTPWSQSGHAQILTQNINDPAGHWTITCAECHSVGYNTAVKNNGFDDAATAEVWKAPAHGDPSNWTKMLAAYPKTASLANIQCENCHGPNNDTTLHANGILDASRISISSDVCGSCHGEPARHGRFQQWEESGHGNYQLAIDESVSASCARCHTGQGFMTWIQQGDLTKQLQGKNGNATTAEMAAIVTKENAQPQTCTVCHDPHNPGSTSGEPTNATVRIMGSTPLLPSGYKAEDVGKGAICITCHNTRNGAHNDTAPPSNFQAPHTAAQGDVLMGENAYFVNTPSRSPHSFIADTCVTCHMEKTSPPPDFSYQGAGTNHSFSASADICGECHSDTLKADALQSGFEAKITALGSQMTKYLITKLPSQVTILEYTPHTYNGASIDAKSTPVVLSKDNIASVELSEVHGQQSYLFKLKNSVSVTYKPAGGTEHTLDLKQVQFQLGDLTNDGKATVFTTTDPLVKVGWNYYLLEGDGSEGIHNPDFTNNVLNASINALK